MTPDGSSAKLAGKSLIVVLGMHRSGTSAITCGLQTLGVELGERLMPPVPDDNPKGYFEDLDVIAINVGLLENLGHDWHTLAPISAERLLNEQQAHLRLKAIALLRSRLADPTTFGIKDPRICRLLPFWQSIFEHLQLKVGYVIAVRNPISVARSIQKRDGIPPEKSHYLWLEHVLPCLLLTEGAPRVVVDYDLLLDDPETQIERIGTALGITSGPDRRLLAEFSREFLDTELRHANFQVEDVDADPLVPLPVRTAFKTLTEIAGDSLALDSPEARAIFSGLSGQLDGMSQAMGYLLRLDNIIIQLNQSLARQQAELAELSRAATDKDQHIVNLDRLLLEQQAQGSSLLTELAECDRRIESQTQTLAERTAELAGVTRKLAANAQQINELKRQVAHRQAEAAALTNTLAERDGDIAALTQVVAAREAQIAGLTGEIAEREHHVGALSLQAQQKEVVAQQMAAGAAVAAYRLEQFRQAPEWRLLQPVRSARNLLTRLTHDLPVELLPFHQLQADAAGWQATGPDPQFLLVAPRAWHGLPGWHWLELACEAAHPLDAQLYFDLGDGFLQSLVIDFQLAGSGLQRIPLYIPPQCRAIRLDPCKEPAAFHFKEHRLQALQQPPELPEAFRAHADVYRALSDDQCLNAGFEPAHGVRRNSGDDYDWCSIGADPWFLVKGVRERLQPGWYLVDLRLRADVRQGNAKLYFDNGTGFSEAHTLPLPFCASQLFERLCYFPSVPRQIRFDPIELPGKFTIDRLQFSTVSAELARETMLQRLKESGADFSDLPAELIWQDIEQQAAVEQQDADAQLFALYGKTFRLHEIHDSTSYDEWIARMEMPAFVSQKTINAEQLNFASRPLISVIMPVYNTPEMFLRRAIESVLTQSYPDLELCIADDCSSDPRVKAVLDEYAQQDRRVKVVFRPENGHISAASNSALSLATGGYIALLDHDDELAAHALHHVAAAINRHPQARVLYSDEDKIDEHGNRSEPNFKPDWNPDLFLAQNYVSHLGVYRKKVLDAIDGFRVGFEGSQDYDLLLRCLPRLQPEEIVHIPKVLYHWRRFEGSTALGAGEKSYTTDAGVKALHDFFAAGDRRDVEVAEGLLPNTYRTRYRLPDPEPLVSLLIPTRDRLELLEPCIHSIREQTDYQNYEILILDNGSVELATRDYFKRLQAEDPRVRVLPYPHPFNFSAINNFGVSQARGELIGLVNNDIEAISPDWLTEMASHALRPEIGCVGAKLYYDDGSIQHAGVIVGLGGVAGHSHKYFPREASGYFHRLKVVQNLSAVTAACLLVRKAVYLEVGGLEEEGLQIAFNDVDFCLKVRAAGYRNLWTPHAELYHHESKSRGTEDTPEKVARFNREIEFMKSRWPDALRLDPCYSPNLTVSREDFSLR